MHYFFLDASALGKRDVVEIGTPLVNHLFHTVNRPRMMALMLALGETISILVRKRHAGQISARAFQQAMVEFRAEGIEATDFTLQSVTNDMVRTSLPLIEQHALNATDALILRCTQPIAAVLRAGGDDRVLVASDARLMRAAQATGLLTWNPASDPQATLDALSTRPL